MSWKTRIASAIAIGVLVLGTAATAQAGDSCDNGIEISTGSLKVAFNFNFSCAVTNENDVTVVISRIVVLDSNGNVRASLSDVEIEPEQTRQVFGSGLNDRYHCDVRGIEEGDSEGTQCQSYDLYCLHEIAENVRVLFDVQSGGNTIGESEGILQRLDEK